MATEKQLNTRIQLKYSTLAEWSNVSVAGQGGNLVLKAGEIGICAIPGGSSHLQTTPPVIMFKVGNGTTPFKDLPWASGLAADVYSWAKAETKPTYAYNEITGTPTIGNGTVTVKQNGTSVGSFTLNQTGDATIELTDTADTDTQYQLVLNGHTLKLQSKAKGGNWTDVTGQSFTLPDNNTTYTFASAATSGASFKVTPSGGSQQTVYIDGLGSAAFKATSEFATSAQGTLADSALQPADIKTGTANGTISVDGTNVAVYGLGSAAYKVEGYFAKQTDYSATANQVTKNTQDITELKETVTGGMHFKGKFDNKPAVDTYNAGDFIIVGSKEYILFVDTNSNKSWVEIGDEGSHLTKAQADVYYVAKNNAITAGTHTKITYDAKGLVTGGTELEAADIPELDASKITSGTLPDARIASAATWNAKQSTTDNRLDVDSGTKDVVTAINEAFAKATNALSAGSQGYNLAEAIRVGTTPAGKATADGDGNVIKDTYATIATVNGKQDTITAENKLSLDLVSGWGAAAKKDVDTSIAANSTSTNLPTSKAVEDRINAHTGIDKVGTVTKVEAGTGLKITGTATTTPKVEIDDSVVFVFNCGSATTNID